MTDDTIYAQATLNRLIEVDKEYLSVDEHQHQIDGYGEIYDAVRETDRESPDSVGILLSMLVPSKLSFKALCGVATGLRLLPEVSDELADANERFSEAVLDRFKDDDIEDMELNIFRIPLLNIWETMEKIHGIISQGDS